MASAQCKQHEVLPERRIAALHDGRQQRGDRQRGGSRERVGE